MTEQSILTVVSAAPSYNLTDVNTTKLELSIKPTDTTNDTWLGSAITQASLVIANYCNRVFPVEALSEVIWVDRVVPRRIGADATRLQLGRFPITLVTSVVEDVDLSDQTTLVAGTDYTVDYKVGQLVRINSDTGLPSRWFRRSVTVTYLAGYGSSPTLAANVPASGPFTLTPTPPSGSIFTADGGVTYQSSGLALQPVTGTPSVGQYQVNSSTGVYTFAAADAGVGVNVISGFTVIPAPLVEAALRLLTARFRSKGRDPFLRGESVPGVGNPTYWIGALPGQSGALAPEVQALVEPYRVPEAA